MGGGCIILLLICIIIGWIIIGGSGGNHGSPSSAPPVNQDCPPPRPSPPIPKPSLSPSPPPEISPAPPPTRRPQTGFESQRLKLVFPVIQAFKLKVVNDPLGITKTWNGKNICGDYKGFICDTVPDFNQKALAGVNFNNFNLGGPNLTITDFLTRLPDIVFFHANSNNFTGSIPTDINKLRYFYELDLSNNKFSGTFPYQVLSALKLKFLDLGFNTFAGKMPPQVFLLNVDYLFINNNNVIQTIPDTLGSTPARYLVVANNKFIGGIPPSIGNASNTLLEVLFLNNQLNGCLPYEIGFLNKATVFDVESNYFTGPIPQSFQCLMKIRALSLARNNFYGVVPEAVCSLPELINFTLSYNYFTQVGPLCRDLIENGVLDVKMNCIVDLPNQRTSADCDKFFSRTHSCPNETSLTSVPCSHVYSRAQLESSDIRLTAPAPSPMQAPRWISYAALFPTHAISAHPISARA